MSQFFKALQLFLKDRQEFDLNAKKIGEDLILSVTPDKKGKGKLFHITIPAEDLNDEIDSRIFAELSGPIVSEKVEFKSTQTDAPETDDDDDYQKEDDTKKESETKSSAKKETKKPSGKKENSKPAKKASKADLKEDKKMELSTENTPIDEPFQTTQEAVTEPTQSEASEDNNEDLPLPDASADKKEDDGPEPEQIFEHFMSEGKRLFDDRKYKDAEASYQQAVDLFPDNEKAKSALLNATKWVKAIERVQTK